jgi:DNA mismatch endonuclease, patch repair protein
MRANRAVDTQPEQAVRSAIHRMGLRFRKHAQPLKGLRCRADVVFPCEKVAVFVDGCFWHSCPTHGNVPQDIGGYWHAKLRRNAERDRRNNEILEGAGWLVIRCWEHDDPKLAAASIRSAVLARRATPATQPDLS